MKEELLIPRAEEKHQLTDRAFPVGWLPEVGDEEVGQMGEGVLKNKTKPLQGKN